MVVYKRWLLEELMKGELLVIELLFQKLDPQNVERNYAITLFKLSSARSMCSTVSQNRSYPLALSLFLGLSRSLSHSECLSMHISLSNECLMCAA